VRRAGWGGLLLGALVAGCAAAREPAQTVDAESRRVEVPNVPFFAQEAQQCGPAALAMVLAWAGHPVAPATIEPLLFTPEPGGTFAHDVPVAARRLGAFAVEIGSLDELLAELEAGHPVLLMQNLGLTALPGWHHAVVVGFDLDQGEMRLHTAGERRRRMPLATFRRTWRRAGSWGLVVLPSGGLPALNDEGRLVAAAAGLERVGKLAAAQASYRAILTRWPGSRGAWIGLGNVSYAKGDLAAAEAAFRQVIMQTPDDPVAWNNLAHVLGDLGRDEEALRAADRALRLGGAYAEASRATRDAIAARLEG
jgi:tetratricopeptide (TPR) repeat protein